MNKPPEPQLEPFSPQAVYLDKFRQEKEIDAILRIAETVGDTVVDDLADALEVLAPDDAELLLSWRKEHTLLKSKRR